MQADIILKNGKIVTVDKAFSIQQAVAVKNGKIISVGTSEAMNAFEGSETSVLDLNGKTVLPGINDSHLHSVSFGASLPPLGLDLTYPAIKSIKEMTLVLAQEAEKHQPGEWIRGSGWDRGSLEECKSNLERLPERWDLDRVSPDNPVIFRDFSGHTKLVNSKALEMAGIDKNAREPDGGTIVKDPSNGEPTGVFIEVLPPSLSKIIPHWTKEEKKKAIQTTLKHFHANGITSFTDAALGPGGDTISSGTMGSECIEIYQEMAKSGELKARVTILLLFGKDGSQTLKELEQGVKNYHIPKDIDSEWFQIPGIKIFADGIPPMKTAWMTEPYPDGSFGSLVIPGETDEKKVQELVSMIEYAHKKGFQIGIHATGDRTIEVAVEALAKTIQKVPGQDLRHYIVHGDFINKNEMEQLVENNCGLSVQPELNWLMADYLPQLVGPKKASQQFPLRSLLETGINLTSSSDAPVLYPNWLMGIKAAMLRKSQQNGTLVQGKEGVTIQDAIKMYTINAAWQDNMENVKGSIETGKLADFCVIDQDILSIDPHEIDNISVTMTIISGEIVFDKYKDQAC
jgi:predicted amidohydrolase YtcJ